MVVVTNGKPFFITPPYGILLHGSKEMPIGLYHLYKASAAQLTRLHYSENSVKLIKTRLCKLAEHDYIQFDATPTAQYRSPYYYVLGNRGVEYVKSLGVAVSGSYRPSKEIGQNYLHLLHHLGVNDVLISAAILKQRVPSYNLADFMLERELATNPFNALYGGKPYKLIPDGFLDFRQVLQDGRQRRTPILFEYDRGTEQAEIIRRKVHAYATMMKSGWYKTRFNVNSITMAFITFEGERRRDNLREWTKEELIGEDRSLVSNFLFTTQQQPPNPAHLWLNPCFYTPYMDDRPVAILGME